MKNQQEIGSNLLMKMFMALLTKNQEIGSNLSMKIFMFLLTKKKKKRNKV